MNKKLISMILCGLICAAALTGCSQEEKKEKVEPTTYEVEGRLPSEDVNYDELIPSNEFVGTYKNEDYTVKAAQVSDEIMSFQVKSKKKEKTVCKWTIEGYFDEQTYYVHYTDAVKTKITYNSKGVKLSSKTEYEDGTGVMMFSGDGKLYWKNTREMPDGNVVFTKASADSKEG